MKNYPKRILRNWLATLFPVFITVILQAQMCVSDNASCQMNSTVVIDVRANDQWAASYLTAIYISSTTQHGTISILNGDSILYSPNANYLGSDFFVYAIEDPNNIGNAIDTGIVSVNVFAIQNCAVSAGNDTAICSQPIQLTAIPQTSGNYVYSWSPASLLQNPNSQSPFGYYGGPGFYQQPFVVTMTDTITNCVATDTVIASSYMPLFGNRYRCNGDSVLLDFGPGGINYFWQTFTDTAGNTSAINQNTQTMYATAPGTYLGYAVFPNSCILTSLVTVIDSCILSVCSVDAGNDTTFCQNHGQLHATPGSAGNYTFEWMPAIALDDPYAQNPTVISGVHNQMYVVAMTDTVTNCIAFDTVYVSAYYTHFDTVYNCTNQPVTLDFGPGGTLYDWLFYNDPQGNSTPISNQTSQTMTVTLPGSYVGYGMYPGCGTITSVFWVIDSCASSVCSVDAGADTTFCQTHGQLHATPGSPGNYSFEWMPAIGLDDPYLQNPTVISGVNNQMYVVVMTDNNTNCTAYDTVYVNAYYFYVDTVYNCNNSPITLDYGPGATNYFWQYYTDPQGNTSPILNQNNQTLTVTQPGSYMGFATFAGCGALTSVFWVLDSCTISVPNVWPGDCNYDLTANMADVLHIGIAYNATDSVRPNATNGWYPQPMTDWQQNFVNCNYKHADADGNGIVDVNDTLAVSLNYSLTHPYRLGAPQVNPLSTPALELVANYDTVGLQTLVTVDIRLGSSTIPVDSIYGISFRITSDALLIDTTLTAVNLNSTWLGTPGSNMFHFRKNFAESGTMDIAECGTNHLNRLNGSGSIGSFLIVTTDNLSGIAICHFDLSEITAVTVSQHYLALDAISDSVVIDPSVPAGIRNENAVNSFTYYPNPANNQITVQLNKPADAIEILDMTGRVISLVKPTGKNATIETSGIANGVYLLRVQSGNNISTQKLTISH